MKGHRYLIENAIYTPMAKHSTVKSIFSCELPVKNLIPQPFSHINEFKFKSQIFQQNCVPNIYSTTQKATQKYLIRKASHAYQFGMNYVI